MSRRHRRSSVLIVLLAALPVASADAARAPRPRLVAFDSCRALVSYAHAGAARTGGGVGVPVRALAGAPATLQAPVATREPDAPAPDAPAAVAAPAAGGTTSA